MFFLVNCLAKSVYQPVLKSLFWDSTCVPGFEYVARLTVKNAVVNLLIRLKRNLKRFSVFFVESIKILVTQNKAIGTALHMLLTRLKIIMSATQGILHDKHLKYQSVACEQALQGILAAGQEKGGELATTPLEFEYVH